MSGAWASFPSPYMLLWPLSRRKEPQATRETGRSWWGVSSWGSSQSHLGRLRTYCVCRLGTAAYLNRAGDSDRHLFPLSPLGSLSPGTWSELDFRSWRRLLRALLQLSLTDFNPLSGIGTNLRNTPEQAQVLLLRGLEGRPMKGT